MIKRIKKIYQSFTSTIKFYIRSFYDPSLYRDVAYRTEGYGLKKLLFVLFVLMLPSLFALGSEALKEYQENWKPNISNLPYLTLTNKHHLIYENQNSLIVNSIDSKIFKWVKDDRKVDFQKDEHLLILGKINLWARLPTMNFFGLYFLSQNHYVPIFSWLAISAPVFGKTILEILNSRVVVNQVIGLFTFSFVMNCLFVVMFIRTFGFVAMKMVLMVLTDSLEYKMACRLLSISAMPSLTIIFLISWFSTPAFEQLKLFCLIIYVFNFYIALRCVKSRSHFRILKLIG